MAVVVAAVVGIGIGIEEMEICLQRHFCRFESLEAVSLECHRMSRTAGEGGTMHPPRVLRQRHLKRVMTGIVDYVFFCRVV